VIIDVRVEVPDDVVPVYERLAIEQGCDVETVLGMDLVGVIDHFLDGVAAAEEE
jgi:hypothetical protein